MSEDVSRFLSQVKELGDRRVEEDEARSRALEEKILQDRKERQARRAERARSISPQKSSPANTPPPSVRRGNPPASESQGLDSSPVLEPPSSPQTRAQAESEPMDSPVAVAASPTKENESPFDADNKQPAATSPTRSNSTARGLSWQKRPNSQASERPRTRPLSVVAAENLAARSSTPPTESAAPAVETTSRDQIAQALSSKDPAWFRQTADRGANSAAYRRNQVEDPDTLDMSSMRAQLPGMSRGSSEPTKEDTSPRPSSPALYGGKPSPLPRTSAQKLDPPAKDGRAESERDEGSQSTALPSPARTSPTRADRPISPTKGLGGFVESAMMKRSDSVNKRWSVKSPTGLQRADSVSANQGSLDMAARAGSGTRSRPTSMLREGSAGASSRPTSSKGQEAAQEEAIQPTEASSPIKLDIKAATEPEQLDSDKATPGTPSRTLDPRRWSPTKSSWLESALNKPESPKPKAPAVSNQPAWMAELAKSKAHKAANPSADLGRPETVSHKHQVSIGGLMRSTAPGISTKPAALGGLSGGPSSTSTTPSRANLAARSGSQSSVSTPEIVAQQNSSTAALSAAEKAKPDTPPKKDFRANLKPKPTPSGSGAKEDAEFKNVFGSLRKTTTQNYVAPDEFKGNIMRGKAALTITGGPKKTERVDEFKEAILAKKKDFQKAQQDGRGVTRTTSSAAENPVPEGLVKKLELGRTGTVKTGSNDLTSKSTPPQPSPKPERPPSLEKRDSVPERATPSRGSFNPPEKQEEPRKTTTAQSAEDKPSMPSLEKETSSPARVQGKVGGSALANRFNPALAGLLARGPPSAASGSSGGSLPGAKPKESSDDGANEAGSGTKLTHMTKGRARGPKRKAPTIVASTATASTASTTEEKPAPKLTESKPTIPEPSKADDGLITSPKAQATSPVDPPRKRYNERSKSISEKIALVDSASKSEDPKPRDAPVKLPGSPKKIHEQVAALAARSRPSSPTKGPEDEDDTVSQPSSPRKLDLKRMSRFLDEAKQDQSPTKVEKPAEPAKSFEPTKSMRAVEPEKPKEVKPLSSPPLATKPKEVKPLSSPPLATKPKEVKPLSSPPPTTKPKEVKPLASPPPTTKPKPLFDKPPSPAIAKLQPRSPPVEVQSRRLPDPVAQNPTKESAENVDSDPVVSVRNGAAMFGGSKITSGAPSATRPPGPASPKPRELPLEPKRSSRPLPSPISPPPASSPLRSPNRSPTRSPTKQVIEVSGAITDFFGSQRPQRKYNVDAAQILASRPQLSGPKIKTISSQLYTISADGKKTPASANNERVLFEREMYLCSHTFTNEAGRKVSEVYFWAGDEVPQATVEDASIFVSREARALGGKLIKMQQSKETPEFLQALGGIVITRRGSSNKYDSLAPHLMCGRRYAGHIVFDEVDFTPAALCSGFAYLVTSAGRCVLWKGKGSGVEELSCARLIGMDYALSGDMDEVEDGVEPANFWDIFGPGSARSGSADHWRLKPNYEKYCTRLFYSDAASRQQIVELSPFSQADLQRTGIYVLDAFFELYIIVGSRAQSQYASFHNALEFAQEYGILAAGMEDRPFVPIATVVLEGMPRDLKSVFRKWRDSDSPTIMPAPSAGSAGSGLKRGRSLRIVPLNQALLALKD